jgi:histidinol-phosphate aminotransferase
MASQAPAAPVMPASQVYTWEPSNSVIAARYGLDPARILRFDLNTSPFGNPLVAEVLAGTFDPPINEYPDSLYLDLATAAATYNGVDPSELVVGAGADEVLDIIAKAFLPPGGRAVVPMPTYSMYGVLTSQRGATLDAIPRLPAADGYAIDLERTIPRLEGADVLWLCAPNNPTGAPESLETLERLADAAAALGPKGPAVVVDEAYVEFAPRTVIPWRDRYPNLIAVRTMSKAFALPGLRVGYAIAQRPTIERLERLRPPGSVSTVSATVAAVALRRPEGTLANTRTIVAERDRLTADLGAIGLPPVPSVTNFLLVPIGTVADAEDLTEALLRDGIVCRTFGPANPLRGHLRFTVRSRSENERLLAAIAGWQEAR